MLSAVNTLRRCQEVTAEGILLILQQKHKFLEKIVEKRSKLV